MKKITLLSFILTLFVTVTFGQITESQSYMSAGTFNSLTIVLPEGSEKDAPKEWVKFFKKYGKTKKNRKTDEYFTDNAKILGLSDNSVDVYTKFNGNTMTVWFDLGGAYLSSVEHPDGYALGEQILMDFGLHLQILMVESEVKAEEKALKNLESNREKLVKDKATLEKNIEDWKARIAQAEADIEQNISDQEAKANEIEQQKTIIEQVKARLAELRAK
ncbi:MAG: hypothetical protein AB8G11_25660 [Saprospiraceae bacterium]